jgi:MerR family regulatory protein
MALSSPHPIQGYQIGQAALRSGVSAANIRFYEKEKLIPARGTGVSSYRIYSDEDLHQTARDTLDAHLGHVRTRLLELRGLEKDLTALRASCDGQGEQCHLIEALHARASSEVPKALGAPRRGKAHAHV